MTVNKSWNQMLHPVNRTTIKSKQKAAERLLQERRGRDGQKGDGEIRMTGKKKNHRVAALLASYITSKKSKKEEYYWMISSEATWYFNIHKGF